MMAAPTGDPGALPTAPPPPPPGLELPNNPGTIEDLHKKTQNVFPMFFDGAKILVNKGLNSHFQVSHTLTLAKQSPGYRFGATYVGTKMLSPSEAFPLMMAEVDPSGNMNANIMHAPTDRSRVKFIAQIQDGKWVASQSTMDYKGDTWTGSLTLGNPDIVNGTGVGVLHYLKSVTPKVALGAELAYQASPQLPGGHIAVGSLASRVNFDKDCTLAATLGNSGQIHSSFWQKCSDQLQMGVELDANLRAKEMSASIGYEVDLAKANVLVRGSVDSNMVCKAVLEKKLLPLPCTLALCGLLDHKKASYNFGVGLIFG